MNTTPTQTVVAIPVGAIDVGDRLRPVDPAYVELIAASMAERGLDSPVHVTGPADGRHTLIAGAHRLAAATALGWKAIPVVIRDVSEPERLLLEIDENLMRHDLTALDRAVFLARRKEVYLALHPETGRGKAPKQKRSSLRFSSAAFTTDTARRLQVSRRSIEQAVKRASLLPELRAALAGMRAAQRGVDLDALGKLTLDQQAAVAQKLRDGWRDKPIGQVIAAVTGQVKAPKDPVEVLLARFNGLTPRQQAAFLRAAKVVRT